MKDLIIRLAIPPGEKLDEIYLQKKYDTSRTPIRESIKRLECDRLVYIIPRKGTFVSQIDIKEFKDIIEIKAVLEGFAGELAIKRVSESQKKELYELLGDVNKVTEKNSYDEIINLDQKFHKLIRVFSNNKELEEILDNYNLKASRFWYYTLDNISDLGDFLNDFEEFYRCMEAKDSEKGNKILYDHVKKFVEYIKYNLF